MKVNSTMLIGLVVLVGTQEFQVTPTADGVNVQTGKRSVFIPTEGVTALTDAVGKAAAFVPALAASEPAPVKRKTAKRKRRTKAEIAAVRAAEAASTAPTAEETADAAAGV